MWSNQKYGEISESLVWTGQQHRGRDQICRIVMVNNYSWVKEAATTKYDLVSGPFHLLLPPPSCCCCWWWTASDCWSQYGRVRVWYFSGAHKLNSYHLACIFCPKTRRRDAQTEWIVVGIMIFSSATQFTFKVVRHVVQLQLILIRTLLHFQSPQKGGEREKKGDNIKDLSTWTAPPPLPNNCDEPQQQQSHLGKPFQKCLILNASPIFCHPPIRNIVAFPVGRNSAAAAGAIWQRTASVTSLSSQTVSCWNSNHRHIDAAAAAFLISVIATLVGWNGMQLLARPLLRSFLNSTTTRHCPRTRPSYAYLLLSTVEMGALLRTNIDHSLIDTSHVALIVLAANTV